MKDPFRITHNFDVSSQAVEELKDDLYEITSDFLDTYGIRPSGLSATDGVRCLAPKNMAAQLVDPKNWGK